MVAFQVKCLSHLGVKDHFSSSVLSTPYEGRQQMRSCETGRRLLLPVISLYIRLIHLAQNTTQEIKITLHQLRLARIWTLLSENPYFPSNDPMSLLFLLGVNITNKKPSSPWQRECRHRRQQASSHGLCNLVGEAKFWRG